MWEESMDQNWPEIKIPCDKCGEVNAKLIKAIENFDGPYLWSFWCKGCYQAQVVRYQLDHETNQWKVVARLDPTEVYVQREPEPGITIKPKASKRGNR